MKIEYSPASIHDLQQTKAYITGAFHADLATSVISKIMDRIDGLGDFPDMGISVSQRFGIDCDYFYLVANRNYVFYRQEGDCIKIIRILNERQDFMYILFGIRTTSQETEDYWCE